VVVATRNDLLDTLNPWQRWWSGVLAAVYAVVAVFFVLEAIQALRPGRFRPNLAGWSPHSEDYPQGVRYFEDVIQRDVAAHWRAWRDVRVDQLNAELAVQLHSLCTKNQAKRTSLRRLYGGLQLMTLLLTTVVAMLIYGAWN
jgi:hypothetical protein